MKSSSRGRSVGITVAAGAIGLIAAVAPAPADSVSIGALKDNTLYEDPEGLFSNGAGDHFFAGKNAIGQIRRGVIAFDVAAAVPAGSTINSVELRLYMSMTMAGPQTISLHRLLADWGEEDSDAFGGEGGGTAASPGDATWIHTFFDTEFWQTPGGDFVAQESGSAVVDLSGFYSWTSAGMAADAQAWLDDPSTNFGWLLKGNESSVMTTKRFDTRENQTQRSQKPELVIDFTPPAGEEADLVDATVVFGMLLSGGLPELADSDNTYLRARSKAGFTAFEPNVMDLVIGAETQIVPTTINLLIESRINNPGGVAKIRLKNWNTNLFEQVGQFPLTLADNVATIEGIDPTNRVRAADGRIELSIRQVVIATFSPLGFDAFIDEVNVGLE